MAVTQLVQPTIPVLAAGQNNRGNRDIFKNWIVLDRFLGPMSGGGGGVL